MQNYYAVLSLPSDAELDEIKRAYRTMALKYHPDVCKEPGAEERFKIINEAYTILRDPKSRARYDQIKTYRRPAAQSRTASGYVRYRSILGLLRRLAALETVDDVLAETIRLMFTVTRMEMSLITYGNPFSYFFFR